MSEKPSRTMAVLAQCHECMGHYEDGKHDCGCIRCALYPFFPYREKEPDLTWMKYNPRKKGW